MSVSLKTRRLLGSSIIPDTIIGEVEDILRKMQVDSEEMGVNVNWSTIHMVLGEEYDEDRTYGELWFDTRRPYLEIEVTGEKR